MMRETMRENKQEICDSLCATLQKTRDQRDLLSLTFDEALEIVIAEYTDGDKKEINVWGDSGIALIKDVIEELVVY